jgi:AcrR family transcriptional regulator
MSDGRRERGSATRKRLIGAARELFGELGFEGTSVTAILARAGVARGALYHHFASKGDLFDAVLEQTAAELADAAAQAAREAPDPQEGLRAGLGTWLEMAVDPAIQRIVLIDPPAVVGWERVRELDERQTLAGLRRNLELIAGHEDDSSAEIELLAQMILGAVGQAALVVAHSDDEPRALLAAKVAIGTLVAGLGARERALRVDPAVRAPAATRSDL